MFLQLTLQSRLTRRRFEYQIQGSLGRYSSFGHAKRRPGGIWTEGFEELNWVAPYDRLLPLGERLTQFRHGDILQLPDPLSGHSEFLSNFFESFRFVAVQPVSLEDNVALANQSKTIRLPVHLVDKIWRMRRVSLQMSQELGREPTDEEFAEEIGISSAKLSQLKTVSIRPASKPSDRKSTRLNSSHSGESRMPSSA